MYWRMDTRAYFGCLILDSHWVLRNVYRRYIFLSILSYSAYSIEGEYEHRSNQRTMA